MILPIDLNIVLPALVDGCEYRLSSSVPPHFLFEWRCPKTQPTQTEIDVFWAAYTPTKPARTTGERLDALEADMQELKEK